MNKKRDGLHKLCLGLLEFLALHWEGADCSWANKARYLYTKILECFIIASFRNTLASDIINQTLQCEKTRTRGKAK